ncbi:glutaredoxin family protein [Marinobacterium jannaschii]|uniref:glutaredoxin family protein n=1 Tax=Marinobacterium jannaschii TaxID=64970 RepID=UPI000486A4CD|nr:glutaredoxin family protein [Marinobacterium jannaschii]
MRQLTLMSTLGCHLCEVAAEILIHTMNPAEYQVDEQDIADDDGLMDRYAVRIPVLVDETSGKELGWPFDQAGLIEFLQGLQSE